MKLAWRNEIAAVFGAAMEAAWLSPVLIFFTYTLVEPGAAMTGPLLFVLLYLTRWAARHLGEAELDLSHGRTLLIYLVAGSLFLALKVCNYGHYSWLSTAWLQRLLSDVAGATHNVAAIVFTVATVAYAWWRALRLAREGQHPDVVFGQFRTGLIAVVVAALLADRFGYAASFVPWVFWFFFWGLLAVATTRLAEIARSRRTTVESYWMPILLAVVALVLLGGGIVSLAYSHELVAAVRQLLAPVLRVLDLIYTTLIQIILILMLPIAYLVEFVIRWLASFRGEQEQQEIELQNPLEQLAEQVRQGGPGLPPLVGQALRVVIAVLIIVLLAKLLARMLQRWRPPDDSGVEELHESIWSRAELWAALRAWWQRLLHALGFGRTRPVAHTVQPTTPEERAAYSIRQLYRRLLDLAAGLGHPRAAAATPYEYLGDLRAALPGCQPDLLLMTEAYVLARYGAAAGSSPDLEAMQQAWQRVKQEGESAKREQGRRS